ncbi:glutamine-hydrolyzing GMP synthase [Treponema brennaborense]|uniref:GMP synthase (glutamine-hydrolyzing) n=1 Tax=Treponema brennaborense (strain DSM 12168 / CIP 105900 / DD5/3) TaxID=906968 RepID=F4LKD2_TREBD|nr:glutamine-hydrolyzing GMP synthase [Treponema brennaborense]AEE16506.1 GMP synthase, small subunit [Treponema brennaborense DSM 12168]
MIRDKIVVLDFGSQYAHLIAKRFRLLGYYSEIALPSAALDVFEGAKGIVFSGGPSSVYDADVPEFNGDILKLTVPVLGLCYGHQLMAQQYGGKVGRAAVGEFGIARLRQNDSVNCPLFKGIEFPAQVWMSHQDAVLACADGFETAGFTKDCPFAAVQDLKRRRFGLQFHVEVKDTPCGNTIFTNFAEYCGMKKNWDQNTVLDLILSQIQKDAAGRNVLLFLSGGVDSTVAFALLNKALGQQRVLGLHIDNGFMRKNESAVIAERYKNFGFTNFICEDASESFLQAIYRETDPQKKRKAVGENFITVRDAVVERLKLDENEWLLAQGTLYPDIIESGGTKNSHTIKTHHNRVDGIQALIAKGLIIEPLKDLYKDEVRLIGMKIGLNEELVMRHPFPGPGLSINVLCSNGALTETDEIELAAAEAAVASIVQADASFAKLFGTESAAATRHGAAATAVYAESKSKTAAAPEYARPAAAVLPVKSVGVQGDFRTYRFPAVLSFADTTGSCRCLPPWDTLEEASAYITNAVKNVNRTVVCLYRKADATLSLQKGYCDKARLDQTREADAIVLDELKKHGWYRKVFQHLTINLPYASAPDRCSLVLRPVVSEDVMTARFAHLDRPLLESIVSRIAALPFVDAVYYDITNKPPATFGWE